MNAPNLTAVFLGDPAGWTSVQLTLASVHTLWGGHTIGVAGSGAATLRLIERGLTFERRYQLQIGPAAAHELLGLCVAHDLLAVELPERAFLIPDQSCTELCLARGRRRFVLLRWDHDAPCPAFEAVSGALLALRQHTSAATPEYEGPYSG